MKTDPLLKFQRDCETLELYKRVLKHLLTSPWLSQGLRVSLEKELKLIKGENNER
jgi:hypothetical protein